MSDAKLEGDFGYGDGIFFALHIAACDKNKRPTCKSRQETAEFLKRSLFNFHTLKSVVAQNSFSNDQGMTNGYQGDENTYFPIETSREHTRYRNIITTNWTSNEGAAILYELAINELTIDDSLFLNQARTTYFTTLDITREYDFLRSDWSGYIADDLIYSLCFQLNYEAKVIKRTRRKFWDDFSVRGGQYSALMIVLTALYALFQDPFQDMKYGLKFAQMRAKDRLGSKSEEDLYQKVSTQIDCLFMLRFWFMYWFSSLHFTYLGYFKGNQKASEFVEHYFFIMHMKNQVQFQLSMRKIAQLFDYVEPKLSTIDQGEDQEKG